MLDSMHPLTHEHLQLGEGVLLRGISPEALQSAGDPGAVLAEAMRDASRLIGATKEGCVFRCVPKLLDATKGARTPSEGELLTGCWDVSLSGTLLEITPENAAMLLNVPPAAAGALQPAPAPVPHPAETVCWVGTMGSGLLAILLEAPVSVGGLCFRAGHSSLGEMPFTLRAQKRNPAAALPCHLLWLKEAAV